MKFLSINTLKPLTITLMTSALLISPLHANKADAASPYTERQHQNQIEQKKQRSALSAKERQLAAVQKQIYALDQQINGLTLQVVENTREIAKNKKEQQRLGRKISKLQAQIAEQEKMLGERLAVRQSSADGAPILEAVFGAKDVGDIISRFNAFNTIAESDASLLKDYEANKQQLAAAKKRLDEARKELVERRVTLKQKQGELAREKSKRSTILNRLNVDKQRIETKILGLKEASSLLRAQEAAAKRAAVAAKQSISSGSGKILSSAKGKFIRPAQGHISQGMGAASGSNGYSYHNGTDIAGPVNSPIVASASGTVIQASSGGPYGNHVYISHNIGGKTYTTVYAHMNSLTVSSGQQVKQGQQIGTLGSTGNSTGPHLHFEIHDGGYQYSASGRTNEIDPQSFF